MKKETLILNPQQAMRGADIRPKKTLGQHFLSNPSVSAKIIEQAELMPSDTVLEIGAGLGALTIPLSKVARKVVAIEKDERMIDMLRLALTTQNIENVELIQHDIMTFDFLALAPSENKIVVVGNLPYNISSQITIKLIKNRHIIDRCVLMFQKEMAKRILSNPGTKDYGRLSVSVQYCADVGKVLIIDGNQFYPRVAVDSEVISLRFRAVSYPADDEQFLFDVIKAAFSSRRKTIKNSLLGSFLLPDSEVLNLVLEQSEIDPIRRAETLSVNEFVRLSNILRNKLFETKA